jgi:lysophospholipase L1-like esterase
VCSCAASAGQAVLTSRHVSSLFQRGLLLAFLASGLVACGGGGATTPDGPAPTHSVTLTVFYDENGNGLLDAAEAARIPDVEVEVAGRTARSAKLTGRAVVDGVPEGSHRVTVRATSLPPFFQAPPSAVSVSSPQVAGTEVNVPLVLPIGPNRPGVYMGFGDSITAGDGSSDGSGYRARLEAQLQQHFGRGRVLDEGISGSRTARGVERIGDSLGADRPAYTLILYGTNDWNTGACRDAFPCDTIDNLRSMVQSVKASQGLPVLATITPVNPNAGAAVERNDWVTRMNNLIRPLARQEGAALADLQAALLREPDLRALFRDALHPNDAGYAIIAAEFFRAITQPAAAAQPPAVSLAGRSTPPLLLGLTAAPASR